MICEQPAPRGWPSGGAHVDEVKVFLGDSSTQAAERYVRATRSRMDDLTAAAFATVDFGTAGEL
jgi:hypothetical protein